MELRDQTWTTSFGGQIEVRTSDGDLVAVVSDTKTANYIAEMHNAQLDKLDNAVHHDFHQLIEDLRNESIPHQQV